VFSKYDLSKTALAKFSYYLIVVQNRAKVKILAYINQHDKSGKAQHTFNSQVEDVTAAKQHYIIIK